MSTRASHVLPAALPEFPAFAPIDFPLRAEIGRLTTSCPQHGDFQFTSLWAWDFGRGGVATLNGNLVARLCPPSGQTFYTFCGTRRLADTAAALLDAAAREGIAPALDGVAPALRLVPANVATALAQSGFVIDADRDHFDYLIDMESLAAMRGNRWTSKREAANRFGRRHAFALRRLDLCDSAVRPRMLALLDRWRQSRRDKPLAGTTAQLWTNGQDADGPVLERLLAIAGRCELLAFGLEVGEELMATMICEACDKGLAILHFFKADYAAYPGSTEALLRETARELLAEGISTLNFGSDDGVPGLRTTKLRLMPLGFVEKFTIRLPDPARAARPPCRACRRSGGSSRQVQAGKA